MDTVKNISKTLSLCPICLKKVNANIFSDGKNSYMEKNCHVHGTFKTVVWKGSIPMENWVRNKERAKIAKPLTEVRNGCPFDCGLCSEHRQNTCTALIEVTQNCNLHCNYCFANSNLCQEKDPSLDHIKLQYESVLKASGICNIQLSGGEPTVRHDLPSIIRMGKELGFTFIQVNTNGLRIAEDEAFVKELKAAGLSSIFLQFDGTNDSIYQKLRGRDLIEVKINALNNCKKYNIGVVLVPTLVPKVNVDNIGEMIDFAMQHVPTVRGVHFQPVSYFGRVPYTPKDEDRITLSEVMDEIEKQTGGKIKVESLKPPGCENALCSFHGSYLYKGNKELINITSNSSCCSTTKKADTESMKVKIKVNGNKNSVCDTVSSSCCCKAEKAEVGAIKAKDYVSRKWSFEKSEENKEKSSIGLASEWDDIIDNIQKNSFSISAMAFQDVWNVDLERLKDCCIHVVSPEGKLIPFCIYNITDIKGQTLYR